MKKLIYIGMMCVFAIAAFAQEAEQIDLGPYGNLLVRTNKKPIEYYETQMKLWEKKVHQNKKDANAWLNYFAATKCAYQMELTKKWKELQTKPDSKLGMGLDMSKSEFKYETIAQEAFKVLPNTFEANYMMHFKDNFGIKRDYTYLLKANELKPFDKKILDALIRYYHLVNDTVNLKKTALEIANSNLISTNEYNLAYNLLAELDDQAILLVTYHELVECIVLQQTKNIKPKVIITTKDIIAPANQDEFKYSDIVLARMGISRRIQEIVTSGRMKAIDNNFKESQRNYVQDVFNVNQPVYVSLNSINMFKDDFSNQLYLHGLTYRYSKQPANYIYNIKDNYEKNYSLDYIKHDISPAPSDNYDQSLYYMYYPSALKLYEFYKEKDLYLQQQEMKKFIQVLAVKSGKDFFKNNEFIDKKIEYPFIAENIDFEKLDKSFQMYHTKSTGFVKGPDYILMGKFEVTNGEFNLFLNNLKKTKNYELYYKYYPDTTLWNKNFAMAFHDPMTNMYNCHPAYSNYPIVNISYEAAVAYCEWLTEQHNKQFELKYPTFFSVRFRLPTEQEWRYAAGSKNEKAITPFPNDNILSCDPAITGKKKSKNETDTTEHCLYLGNIKTDKGYQADGGFHTTSVTSYLPNAFGIYNTFGNVAEMTSTKGIVKGGSWDDVFEDCTFDKNSKLSAPDSRVGFRMVMEIMEDINDMPTTKISPNLGVDKSEITHFYWEEFLNYQKQYYGENSPEYRDNLPDTTLVKKGECEHYNSESYNHPAYRNMPMIGITQQQAQNYTTWRTNRVFEWYLESNEYITRILNAPKSDFTVEKYYQNGLTDYTINTIEKYPYVPVFSLPSSEDYQRIKQLAIANNKLNTKSKSVKMTFEIDSIALCNLKEINTYIDPKFKTIVYYLESGIAEWTSDSNKVINGSIEVNENHKKGVVTDANQLKYIGFRNKVEWKKWEGKSLNGPFHFPSFNQKSIDSYKPVLKVKIAENFYCDQYELRIQEYANFILWNKQIFGENSKEYKIAIPDTTGWTQN
jgi:formylglycine-generating enzyme required for sulfatase activity